MRQFFNALPNQPIIYAICIVIGLWMGKTLYQDHSYQLGFSNAETGKGKLHDILKKIDSYYVDDVNVQGLQEKTINHLLEQLDPHSYYLSSEVMKEEQERMNGNFNGIGVQFRIIDDTISVLKVISGGPSEKIGIEAGDKFIEVNHQGFVGDSITSEVAMKNLKGEKGTEVEVKVLRKQKKIDFNITRGEIPLKSVLITSSIENGVGYIKINRFAKKTVNEFNSAIKELQKKELNSLIIDVRDNPGGLMEAVVQICEQFLKKKQLIVYTKGRNENEEYKCSSTGDLVDLPLYILINKGSASASEILAGAMQDNDRATIIGRRSFGKGLVQRPFLLKDGSSLRLTIARYYTPVGRCIQKDYGSDKEDYYNENYLRLIKGELSSKDSIPIHDSLKFYTPKGKLVFGGGGIIPDEFISIDTSNFSNGFKKLRQLNLIDKFFLYHISDWKKSIQGLTIEQAYQHLLKIPIWDQFNDFVALTTDWLPLGNIKKSKRQVHEYLLARILEAEFGSEGTLIPTLQNDLEIQKALELIRVDH